MMVPSWYEVGTDAVHSCYRVGTAWLHSRCEVYIKLVDQMRCSLVQQEDTQSYSTGKQRVFLGHFVLFVGQHVSCSTKLYVVLCKEQQCLLVQRGYTCSSSTRMRAFVLNKHASGLVQQNHVRFSSSGVSCKAQTIMSRVILKREGAEGGKGVGHTFSLIIRLYICTCLWAHLRLPRRPISWVTRDIDIFFLHVRTYSTFICSKW